jgi:hypothetical protein
MISSSSFLRRFVLAAAGALFVGCSGAQTSSTVSPALHDSTSGQPLVAEGAVPSPKCQHSPGMNVTPCNLVFTRDRPKFINVGGREQGAVQELDNCRRFARIYDASGPAYIVTPKRANGTCAAVFIYHRGFAILNIGDEL